jgi:hypothetical protein
MLLQLLVYYGVLQHKKLKLANPRIGINWSEEYLKFIEPYEKAHSEWLKEHPIECDCWCHEDEETMVSEPVKKPAKRHRKSEQLALL